MSKRLNNHSPDRPLVYSLQKLCQIGGDMYAMGVTPDGASVVNRILYFRPTFLMPLLDDWLIGVDNLDAEMDDDRDQEIFEKVNEFFKDLMVDDCVHEKVLIHRLRVVGFCNYNKDLLLEVHCKNLFSYMKMTKVLRNGNHVTYHTDIPFTNQLLVQKERPDLSYQDWVQVDHHHLSGYVNLARESVSFMSPGIKTTSTIFCSSPFEKLRVQPTMTHAPKLLKAFVRVLAGSQSAIRTKERHTVLPDSRLPNDRIFFIGVTYVWQSAEPIEPDEYIFTTCPVNEEDVQSKLSSIQGPHSIKPNRHIVCVKSELELLSSFVTNLIDHDPDDLFHYPDREETFTYIVDRIHRYGDKDLLKWERFRSESLEVPRSSDMAVQFKTRNCFDILSMMKKKFKGSADEYDLYSMSLHKKARHKDANMRKLKATFLRSDTLVAQCLRTGDVSTLTLSLIQQLDLMVGIERDLSIRLECANLSRITDVEISRIVRGDEQVRVYSAIYRFCVKGKQYLNLDALAKKPLRYDIQKHPPTYADPPDNPLNLEYREMCKRKLAEKKLYHERIRRAKDESFIRARMTEDEYARRLQKQAEAISKLDVKDDMDPEPDDEIDEDEDKGYRCLKDVEDAAADEKEGGNVVLPSPAYYGNTPIAVLDFNSLYPSIMIAYNLSYDTAVYDPQYEAVPGIKYINVRINANETVRYALGPEGADLESMACKGCMPRLLRLLLDQRAAIRKEQKNITDKFFWTVKEMLQLGMKTVSNAVYGFLGVNRGGKLPVRSMMQSVTSIGRYLQKECTDELAKRYKIIVVYGDTDSIFILVFIMDGASLDERVYNTMVHYCVPGIRTWEDVCLYYEKQQPSFKPEDRFDIRSFSPEDQVHAILFIVYNKLADECTSFFPKPIKLGFEKMALNVYMGQQKKYYFYLKYDENNPSKKKSLEITGMPCKKREWTPWTRKALDAVTGFIQNDQLAKIEPFIRDHVQQLIERAVPYDQLTVTKNFKKMSEYKSVNNLSVQLALRVQDRIGRQLIPETRLPFVIVKGNEPFYKRAMHPEEAKANGRDLDWMYYLTKQFYKPMKALLVYHPELFDYESFIVDAIGRLQSKISGIIPMSSFSIPVSSAASSGKRLADFGFNFGPPTNAAVDGLQVDKKIKQDI